MSRVLFHRNEITWLLIGIFLPIMALIALAYFTQAGSKPLPLIPFIIIIVIFVIILLMFYRMTITVWEDELLITFGIGMIKIKQSLENLESISRKQTPLLYGLGLKITPEGMFYSANSREAVKLEFSGKNKKSILIGSPKADELKEILESTITP